MNKKILFILIAAVLVISAVFAVIYKWPYNKTIVYENVALWFSNQDNEKTSGFESNYADISVSVTIRRKITAPDSYSGTITVNGVEYFVSARDYGGFFDAWQEKIRISGRSFVEIAAEIEKTEQLESGVSMPVPQASLRMFVSEDFSKFYLMEFPLMNSGRLNAYIYPAESDEEALTVYDSLRESYKGAT